MYKIFFWVMGIFMITLKEMQFIESWASRIPMPGEDYSKSVIDAMNLSYKKYKEKYQGKEYTFIFSNGEEINFEILPANLCHLLGIDYNNIKGEYFDDYRRDILNMESSNFTSFELLESILEHSDKIIQLDNDPNNKIKILNYYKTQIKCNIFDKISDFENFNFAAINYDPQDGKFDYENQKMLFIPSNEILFPYFMMGLKLSNNTQDKESIRKFFASTLLAPQDPKKYFENQEVMIPTKIFINDILSLNTYNASAEDKIKILTMYKAIIHKYGIGSCLNISGDYESMLNELANFNDSQKLRSKSKD